jgi:hypothetical protein
MGGKVSVSRDPSERVPDDVEQDMRARFDFLVWWGELEYPRLRRRAIEDGADWPHCIARPVTPGQLTALLRVVNTRVGLSVRAGGHSSVCMARPLVVDVRGFNEVRVDPSASTVTVQAGCTNRDVDDACAPHGLAVTLGNASTVGAIGAMLGGGVGFLARWSGLTIDALVSCRVALADGNIIDCDADRHADLFWALRGGGGNFGIVLECTLRAVPVGWDAHGRMFAGARVVRHSQRGCCGNGIGAVESFKAWRDYAVSEAPDCVSLDCVLPCGGPMVQQYTRTRGRSTRPSGRPRRGRRSARRRSRT